MSIEEVDREIDPKKAAEHLRDQMLMVIRSEIPKPWQQCSESEQRRLVTRVEHIVNQAVREVCDAIAAQGIGVVKATLKNISSDAKGGLLSKIEWDGNIDNDDKIGIIDHINRAVTVVLMDPTTFMNYSAPVQIDKDEPLLPMAPTPGEPDPAGIAAHLSKEDAAKKKLEAEMDAEPEEDPLEVPAELRRPQVHQTAGDAGDAADAAEIDEETDGDEADLIDDDEAMSEDEVANIVNIENPVKQAPPAGPKPTGPRKRTK